MSVFEREARNRALVEVRSTLEQQQQEAQRRATVQTELSPEVIGELVNDYYQQELREEEEWRISDRPDVDLNVRESVEWDFLTDYGETPSEVEAYCHLHGINMADLVRYEDAQRNLDHHQDRVNKGDWRAGVCIAEPFLRAKGLIDKISDRDYRRLCNRLLHAYCDGLRARIAMFEGKWGFSPHSPYVRDAIALQSRPERSTPRLPSRVREKSKGTISSHAVNYIKEKGIKDPKSRAEHEKTLELLADWHGRDKQIDVYAKDDIVAFKDALGLVPANFKKFFPNATMKEAIEKNANAKRRTLDSHTIQRKLDHVRRFFDWAVGNNLIDVNPAANVKIVSKKRSKKSDRKKFVIDELQRLFRSPLFVGCRSNHRWKEAGPFKIRDHRYWLPLLALWTGARQAELAQLLTSDIKLIDGIQVICITDEEEVPGGALKKVKNSSSVRHVPVHDQLRLLGFSAYVERMKRAKNLRLFPDCERARDESFSPYSKHFRNLLDSCHISRPGVVFHSFRHLFEDAMRAAKLEGEVRHRLTGREIEGSVALYGDGYPASVLKEEIDKVRHDGLDLSHLYVEKQ